MLTQIGSFLTEIVNSHVFIRFVKVPGIMFSLALGFICLFFVFRTGLQRKPYVFPNLISIVVYYSVYQLITLIYWYLFLEGLENHFYPIFWMNVASILVFITLGLFFELGIGIVGVEYSSIKSALEMFLKKAGLSFNIPKETEQSAVYKVKMTDKEFELKAMISKSGECFVSANKVKGFNNRVFRTSVLRRLRKHFKHNINDFEYFAPKKKLYLFSFCFMAFCWTIGLFEWYPGMFF